MRDEEYFNGKMFVFTNDEVKNIALEKAKEENKPLYLFVDEAVREKLEREGTLVEKRPKVPVMQ